MVFNVGVLMGFTNMAATIPGFIVPALVGVLTHGKVMFKLKESSLYYVLSRFCKLLSLDWSPGTLFFTSRQAYLALSFWSLQSSQLVKSSRGIGPRVRPRKRPPKECWTANPSTINLTDTKRLFKIILLFLKISVSDTDTVHLMSSFLGICQVQ